MVYIDSAGTPIRQKKNTWKVYGPVIISVVISVISLVVSGYYETQNADIQKRVAELQNQSNALQNKLYNYKSTVYSACPYSSTLIGDSYFLGSDSICVSGQVEINLQVSTPYASCALRISLANISFVPVGFVDWNRRNETLLYITDPMMTIAIPMKQGWSTVLINPWVTLACSVNPQALSSSAINSTNINFPLGNLIFNATLIDTSTNQTVTNLVFTQYVYAQINIAKNSSS